MTRVSFRTVRRRLASSMAASLTLVVACNDPESSGLRPTEAGASMRRLPETSVDVAFDAAVEAIRQHFTQAFPSRDLGFVEGPMVEYDQRGGTGRIRDTAIGYRNRLRRKATIWVAPSEAGALVRCQVRVQRLDTSDQRTFQSQQEFNDVPNATPIEREAGVDPAQEQSWTDLPRDQAMERELLSIVINQIELRKQATESGA